MFSVAYAETLSNPPVANSIVTTDLVYIVFGVAFIAVAITLWATNTFHTKKDAENEKSRIDAEHKALWEQMNKSSAKMSEVAENVAYIKGRVEPPVQKRDLDR